MKKILNAVFLFSAVLLLTVCICSFTERKATLSFSNMGDTCTLLSDDVEYIVKDGVSNYKIIYSSDAFVADQVHSSELGKRIKNLYGLNLRAYPDSVTAETQYEILIGDTNRALSSELMSVINSIKGDGLAWAYAFRDGKLAFAASSPEAFDYAKGHIFDFMLDDGFAVKSDLFVTGTLSFAEYEAWVEEMEMLERQERLDELRNKIASFDDSLFGQRTPMPTDIYKKPETYPIKGEHPRLMLTNDIIPDIKALLEDPYYEALAENFWYYADMDTDGSLKPLNELDTTYNYDGKILMAIEAKALAYLLTGEEFYGYEAILAAKNHMLTLVMSHDMHNDIYRCYGWSMMVTGEVYDWCYDLMTETDKSQFVRGVQKYYCEDCVCGLTDKMTIGFPPTGMNAVQGHGTHVMLYRDYMAFSIAIYDEYPDWWELVAGRYYEEYIPAGSVFLTAGATPQGSNSYGWAKVVAPLYAAYMIKTLTGELPYPDDIQNIAKYFMHLRLPNGRLFQSGDGTARDDGATDDLGDFIFVLSALFPSELNQINYKVLSNNYTKYRYTRESSCITPTTTLLYRAYGLDYEPESSDINSGLELVLYTGWPVGQMTARNSWEEDAAAVFMRVGELSCGNHDHEDAGTFQIYYKGCFTSESGQYGAGSGYGTAHHSYWHQATIAHNGILVYNPALASTEDGWYSGGQASHNGVNTLDEWLNTDKQKIGTVTGASYYYSPKDGSLEYAYLAGDISSAYSSETVEALERRMLTVYTDNPEFPMFFTVYDYVKSADKSFTKSFLMHTVTEPIIDGNTATYIQNEGKMVLTTLTDGAELTKIGGEGRTYWINDTVGNLNIAEEGEGTGAGKRDSDYISDGALWGRIQINNTGKSEDHLLNVIYVTDADNETVLTPQKIESDTVIGMQLSDIVAVYSKTDVKNRVELEFATEGMGLKKYYLSGLSEGSWTVRVDGVTVAHTYTSSDSGIISFTAPTGDVTVTPGSDVRPANTDAIKFYTGGAILPEDTQYYYTHDEEYVLPELESTPTMIFAGWYPTETSSVRIYSIPVGTRGTQKVYAKFYRSYIEDYEGEEISINAETRTVNGIRYVGARKVGSSYQTVRDDESENSYLIWTLGEGGSEMDIKAGLASLLGDRTSVTYKIDLALNGENLPIKSNFRLRGESYEHTSSVFTVSSDGKIYLGGSTANEIATLGKEFTSLIIVIDFASAKMYALDVDGEVITQKDFVLPSVDSHLTPMEFMQNTQYLFDWYTSSQDASASLLIDNICITSGIPENANIADPNLPNAIIYNDVGDAQFPKGTKYSYNPLSATPLPENITSALGMEFLGWYTDRTYTERVTEVPAGYSGAFTVYARFDRRVKESFEGAAIDMSNPDGLSGAEYSLYRNGISYSINKKKGSSLKTLTENGNSYLLWNVGESDPDMFVSMNVEQFLFGESVITYEIDLALAGNNPVARSIFRLRGASSSNVAIVFTVTDKGEIRLGGKETNVIGVLSAEFTRIKVSVDFSDGMMYAFNEDGHVITKCSLALSSADEGLSYMEYMQSLKYAVDWYYPSQKSNAVIRIDNMCISAGLPENANPEIPANTNVITYVGLGGAKLPEDAPKYYDPDTETRLPADISSDGRIFVGWYADESYTEKIDFVPKGQSGAFPVYARWAVILSEDFENTSINISNPDDLSSKEYSVNENGFSYRISKKKGAGFKTVKDEITGNTYLVWAGGTEDPNFFGSGTLAEILGDMTAVTFSVKMSKDGDNPVFASAFRIQETGSSFFSVFKTTASGDVLLAGDSNLKICSLTNEFTTVTVTVDFAEETVTAYNPDGSVAKNPDTGDELVAKIEKPSASAAESLVDYINYTDYVFNWYVSSSTQFPERALRIDDVTVIPGKYKA